MMNAIPGYKCQHCGSLYPPAAFMYHKPGCPHGQLGHERLASLPTHVLESELEWRKAPRILRELIDSHGKEALAHAELLSTCLVLLMQIARLTRYTKAKNHTVLNVPNSIICDMDRVLAERGIVPIKVDDHAD